MLSKCVIANEINASEYLVRTITIILTNNKRYISLKNLHRSIRLELLLTKKGENLNVV